MLTKTALLSSLLPQGARCRDSLRAPMLSNDQPGQWAMRAVGTQGTVRSRFETTWRPPSLHLSRWGAVLVCWLGLVLGLPPAWKHGFLHPGSEAVAQGVSATGPSEMASWNETQRQPNRSLLYPFSSTTSPRQLAQASAPASSSEPNRSKAANSATSPSGLTKTNSEPATSRTPAPKPGPTSARTSARTPTRTSGPAAAPTEVARDVSAAAGRSQGSSALQTAITHSWPWSHGMTALILVVASLLVLLLYWLETSEVGRWPRLGLATLRILQLSIVLFMMYGWVIQRQRTDLPDLAVIVDESASMSWHDHYTESREREQASEYARKAGLNPVTRWNVATALLAGEEQPWLPEWAQRYRLNCFLVGEETRPLTAPSAEQLAAELRAISPKQASSRLGDGLLQVLDAQRGRPTAAVVFLTDGASTGGVSLAAAAQAARQRQVPIYVVGLGDASPPRDRRLFDLRAEEIVFVDDLLTLDVQVASTGATQSPLQVQLRRAADGAVLDEQIVQLSSANSTTAVRLVDRPRGEGTIDYLIELLPEEGETNLDNNRLVHRVEVRDQTLRVLVIQGTPSYEYRALRKLLSRALKPGRVPAEKAIALTTILQEADAAYVAQEATAGTASPTALAAFPVSREELFAYDVVIFGDTDPALLGRQELQNLVDYVGEQGGGVVFSAGPRHLPKAFEETPLTELFPFSSRIDDPFFEIAAALSTDDSATRVPGGEPPASTSGEANRFDGLPTSSIDANVAYQVLPTTLGWESPLMQLGATRRESETIWSQLPGVYAGGRMPALKPGVRVLAEFHGGPRSAAAARPALTLQFLGAGKVLFLALDETYRWSRYEGGEQAYARFWLQMIRYLSRSRLRSNEPAEIASDRDTYQAQDEVQLYVRFGDERLVPEQDDAVEILVESADARRRSVRLSRDTHQRRHFRTTLRDLPTGTYRATLVSPLLEPAPRAVEFVVEPPTAEMTQLQMRTQDLKQVASVSGGRFYTLASANRLSLELPRGRQLPVETLPAEPIWNSSLLTSLFLVLLTSEWIIRKQLGML